MSARLFMTRKIAWWSFSKQANIRRALAVTKLESGDDNVRRHSILELHGLGKEIWQGVDPEEYVRELRGEWKER